MKVDVVAVVVVVLGVDMVTAVEEVVDLTETPATVTIHSARTMVSLEVTDPQKKEILGGRLKGAVGLAVDSVVVAGVVLAMEKMVMVNALIGYLNVAVELDVGKQYVQVVVHYHV